MMIVGVQVLGTATSEIVIANLMAKPPAPVLIEMTTWPILVGVR